MPRYSNFPTLFDNVLQLHISKLKQWGYLEPDKIFSTKVNWAQGGQSIGDISMFVNMYSEQPFIELDYNWRGEPRKYKVQLVSVPSNLNKGEIWYFQCPKTYKRCRILYSIGGYFLHREAFRGCFYESQLWGKKARTWDKLFASEFAIDRLFRELHKKHLKKTYAGKPTKKYSRLMAEIELMEKRSFDLSSIL